MIEVPSIALNSDSLAQIADFFSIGSNDLIQYTMAVDRGNEAVSKLYNPLNPAVLKLIKMTVENAHKNNIKVAVCGEMASIPELAFLLIGLGIDELSMNAASLLTVKKIIRSINFKDAFETAAEVLKLQKASQISNFLTQKIKDAIAKNLKSGEKNEN